VTFPTNLVPADATAVVFNLTGTDADGPTWLDVMTTDGHYPDTSNLNLVAGETRANLVTSVVSDYNGTAAVKIFTGPGGLDMIVDVAGYYSQGGPRFTSVAPQRVLDEADQRAWRSHGAGLRRRCGGKSLAAQEIPFRHPAWAIACAGCFYIAAGNAPGRYGDVAGGRSSMPVTRGGGTCCQQPDS
jgi:hypothetical protein